MDVRRGEVRPRMGRRLRVMVFRCPVNKHQHHLVTWGRGSGGPGQCAIGCCLIHLTPIFFYINGTLCMCYNYKHKYDV